MLYMENVCFTYAGMKVPALHHISLEVNKGETFGLLGPSGAGKSTTQKILIGLLKGYQGKITIFDRDLTHWRSDYYEHIGVSFELPNHYLKLTALENLELFRSLYSKDTENPQKLLELVGLEKDGNKRVAQYSKGMSSRLNIARALLHKPRLLFLDEPTSGLDPVHSMRIKSMIKQKKAEGTTIFLTTHNMAIAEELCDRVAFIVDGKIALIDSPQALKLRYGKRNVRIEYGETVPFASIEYPLDNLGHRKDFQRLLQDQYIQTIHTQETTLERIFIEVTGRSLQ